MNETTLAADSGRAPGEIRPDESVDDQNQNQNAGVDPASDEYPREDGYWDPVEECDTGVVEPETTTSATLEWVEEDLRRSGLDWAAAEAAGFRTISHTEAVAVVGFGLPPEVEAYAITFMDPATGVPMKCKDGERDFIRLRLKEPLKLESGEAKYISPKASGNHAFITKDVHEALSGDGPLVMTEGEKKALAATLSGIPTVGLTGVWGWTDKESHDLLPEIARYIRRGREVVFVLDSDVAINASVALSVCELNKTVHAKSGVLRVAVLPPAIEPEGKVGKNGMDDLLVREGPERLKAALANARPVTGNAGEIYVALASAFLAWCAEHQRDMGVVAEAVLHKGYWDGIDHTDRKKFDQAASEVWPEFGDRLRARIVERLDEEFAFSLAPANGGKQLRSGAYVTAPGQTEPLKIDGLDEDIAYCIPPGTHASRPYPRRMLEIASRPERSAESRERPKSASAADMADAFISRPELTRDNVVLLRSYRDAFYIYRDGFYEEISTAEVKAEVMGFIRRHPDYRDRATKATQADILEHLKASGVGRIDSAMLRPLWIDGESFRPATGWTAMKNRLVNIEALARAMNGDEVSEGEITQPLTPKLFATVKMDYDFDPEATCPRFDRFLGELLPDPELRESIQMMLGLLLLPDTSYNVAFFFLGTGGNGKSQLVHIAIRLVGAHNVCHVPFASLEQKHLVGNLCRSLVNVIGDGDAAIPTDMSQQRFEGVFKNVTDGGLINLEPKFKDAQTHPATARFLMAMNTLPPFSDRTDGVWDRLRIFPFNVRFRGDAGEVRGLGEQIADEELPGIFNFAVAGLAKLRAQLRFPETAAGLEVKRGHRSSCDHEREFLEEGFMAAPGSEEAIKSMDLYRRYGEWMKDRGYKPRGETQFAAAVRRVFPDAEKAKQRFPDGSRVAAWTGIRAHEEAI